jgi:DNA-binding CsgD family transcriptional regulator
MTRQLLLEIFNQRLFLDLVLFILSYGLSWIVILKLGFKILQVDIKFKSLITATLLGSFVALFIKPFTPGIATFFITLAPLLLSLKFYGKTKWIIASWVTFLLILATSIGLLIIIVPLAGLNRAFASFFYVSRYGMMVGVLIETLIPAILLGFLNIFNISLIPRPGKVKTFIAFIEVYIFGALLFLCYHSFMQIWEGSRNIALQFFIKPFIAFLVAAGALVALYLKKVNDQKKLEEFNEQFLNKVESLTSDIQKKQDLLDFVQGLSQKKGVKVVEPEDPKIFFTPRELQVIKLYCDGNSYKEIGDILEIGERTVSGNIGSIKNKINAKDATQIIPYAIKHKIVDLDSIVPK